MNNHNDSMMLKDLTSVITELQTLLDTLPRTATTDAVLPEQEDGRGLLVQWQKLFSSQSAASAPAGEQTLPDLSALTDRLHPLMSQLQLCREQAERQQQQGGEQLLQAARDLQESPFAPPQLPALLHDLEAPGHFLYYLWPLLECYQQAIGQCSTRQQQGQLEQRELCQRLLQLIDELDYGGEVGREIGGIQQQLLQHNDTTALPPLCLRLIELVIQGSRTERQHSTRFLTRLNEGLEGMQGQCAHSVREGQALISDRQASDADLTGELKAIGAHLASQEQTRLTREIEQRVTTLLTRQAHLQQREASLLARLQSLEGQVNSLQKEAHDYQQRLTSQNEKLLIDNLTQIYNRTALNERLKTEFRRWQRTRQPLCITLLDIDHFKNINDKFGHLAGDKALRLIARTLRQGLRESDFVARFGGEEFVVLMLNVDPALLHRPLQQLRQQIEAIPFRFKQERVTITVSMGATLLKNGDTVTSALERADQALYRAKNAGRNQLVIL
ncbi:diguanylate cyclase [Oceanimonas sp. CHS3-5]|uniref:GGDEF domain-containing protein n=1 Tax=Oceanimonas sp. CHS3-5 TaxID=3068186 RepID=UPI00273DC255|nr:GGDEF domain-containing protein [Oceanimonas sp. CHS3-5]MDP5290773.1 diguanylate cyclase [Oceanimonas sp. CHS3-5]